MSVTFKLKKISLYLPWFNSEGPLKSEVSHLKNLSLFNFQALDPKFVLALEPRFFEQVGLSFGIRPYIHFLKEHYKEAPKKLAISVLFGVKSFLPPFPPHAESLFWKMTEISIILYWVSDLIIVILGAKICSTSSPFNTIMDKDFSNVLLKMF